MTKNINIKELDKEQLKVIKYINNQIIEHQQVFGEQPEELLITKDDFNKLAENDSNETYKHLVLGSIKIYHI